MSREVLAAAVVLIVLIIVACTPASPSARYTVEQYRSDQTLRLAQLKRCTRYPATVGQSAECINAREAERLEGIGSFQTLPPLKLDPPKL